MSRKPKPAPPSVQNDSPAAHQPITSDQATGQGKAPQGLVDSTIEFGNAHRAIVTLLDAVVAKGCRQN
jgi:hypothetical protein